MLPPIKTLGLPNEQVTNGQYYHAPWPGAEFRILRSVRADEYLCWFCDHNTTRTVGRCAQDALEVLSFIFHIISTHDTHGGNTNDHQPT